MSRKQEMPTVILRDDGKYAVEVTDRFFIVWRFTHQADGVHLHVAPEVPAGVRAVDCDSFELLPINTQH
jgi:hypothetical protein